MALPTKHLGYTLRSANILKRLLWNGQHGHHGHTIKRIGIESLLIFFLLLSKPELLNGMGSWFVNLSMARFVVLMMTFQIGKRDLGNAVSVGKPD